MSSIDWVVLLLTILSIVIYGIYKSRQQHTMQSFLLADRQLPWYHVCLSVMATQASAITFLSAPGQAFNDGMRFVQFYFGLPLAMVVLCVTFVPAFHKLKVFTAYEYLEKRFDHKTRLLTSGLFLLQRGVSTGISIYAPSIILSTILNVPIAYTTLFIGMLVMVYTIYGGTKAVSHSQVLQMSVIFFGLLAAGVLITMLLKHDAGFVDSLRVAGAAGRMNIIDFNFDWNNRYNVWSGIIGGFFLQLSYFGTDQSQVGRYITAKSVTQSRMGLVMNGLVKIPMQFVILLIGVLVFSFYQFNSSPLFYNSEIVKEIKQSSYSTEFRQLESEYERANNLKPVVAKKYLDALRNGSAQDIEESKLEIQATNKWAETVKEDSKNLIKKNNALADVNDSNYVFLYFVTHHFPIGMIGLLIAIIFLASMGSLAAGLNSLASTTAVDVYMRSINKTGTDKTNLRFSRMATFCWGVFCIICALYAGQVGNLIEAVNILGSLFYGTILGIFIVAFYVKNINGTSVFIAAIITELMVIAFWYFDVMAFLWLNVAGCAVVVVIASIINLILPKQKELK